VAHHTEQAGFPQLPLNAGMTFRLRVLSPTTGAAITGVTATEWSLYGRDASELPDLEPDELPTWVPEQGEGDGA
jgi:hypothetical protein